VESRYQDGDVVVKYRAGEEDIAKITQPRTTASLASDQASKPQTQPKTHGERDSISELAWDEKYIRDAAVFYQRIGRSKMVHVVTDGARPDPGAAGWGAVILQNKATNNTMEPSAVMEILSFLPPGMVL
jgi:hypothetical protein